MFVVPNFEAAQFPLITRDAEKQNGKHTHPIIFFSLAPFHMIIILLIRRHVRFV